MSGSDLQKEAAATEKRHWVRIIRACNNHCMFCLDSGALDGVVLDEATVKAEIAAGRQPGEQRLILSGGEASIHPRFIEFVRYGRELGYSWIQTITNGRVFSYAGFVKRAAGAGLNEVTFSIHGHTPELHDRLTGVRGGFAQALQGLDNVRREGLVANVDIVLNRINYKHLREIVLFFHARGIHEFDLLHLVPFGRAFDTHRDELFLDIDEAAPALAEAFELRKSLGLYLWTNRFPIRYLEGAEDLIQEPKKILDEVRGRHAMFAAYAAQDGGTLDCEDPQRCPYCFMDPFCQVFARYRKRLLAGGFRCARFDLTRADEPGHIAAADYRRLLGEQKALDELQVRAADVAQYAAGLAPFGGALPGPVRLRLDDPADAPPATAGAAFAAVCAVDVLGPADAAVLRRWPGVTFCFPACKDTAALLSGDDLPLERATAHLAPRALRSQVLERELDPAWLRDALRQARARGLATTDIPACAGGRPGCADVDLLEPGVLDAQGRLEPFGFAEHYILNHYYTKSRRCGACAHDATCRGHHVNYIRAFGYAVQRPLPPVTG